MISVGGSYDVVILGSGIAGLAAALAAHALGLRPVVLEKAARVGGGTVHSYGLIWVGQNHLAEAAGHGDTREDVLAYMRFLGGGTVDDARLSAFVDRSPEALKFFEKCGVRFRLVGGVTDHYYDKAPGSHAVGRCVEVDLISGFDLGAWRDRVSAPDDVPCFVTAEEQIAWGGINSSSRWDAGLVRERQRQDMRGKGLGLVCHFLKALRDRGVSVLTDQEVANLAVENGRVTGVFMRSGDFVAARKGIVLGAEIGGIVHRIENSLRVMLSYTIPPEQPGGMATCVYAGIVELCSPHTLLVNKYGRRFADETFFQGIVPQLRLFDPGRHEYPNLPGYLIFDAQYLKKYSFANRPVGSDVPRPVSRAGTLPELAAKLGIDGAELEQTVRRFNFFVDAGSDEDFHRGEHQWKLASAAAARGGNGSLGTVEEPPFYGIALHPAGGSSAGLLTDAHARVLHQRHRPIPGLYASGNAASATEQGVGYQAGLSLASSMTFSYLAIRHMLGGG